MNGSEFELSSCQESSDEEFVLENNDGVENDVVQAALPENIVPVAVPIVDRLYAKYKSREAIGHDLFYDVVDSEEYGRIYTVYRNAGEVAYVAGEEYCDCSAHPNYQCAWWNRKIKKYGPGFLYLAPFCIVKTKMDDAKSKERSENIESWLQGLAYAATRFDRDHPEKLLGEPIISNSDMLAKLLGAWNSCDKKCKYCRRDIEGCENGKNFGASKERESNHLTYSHPKQVIDFICVMCNWAAEQYTKRQFRLGLQKIVDSTNVQWRKIPIDSEDIDQIKRMRKDNYAKEDREMKKRSEKAAYNSTFIGTTATAKEFVEIAREAGKMDRSSNIEGIWTVIISSLILEGKKYFKTWFQSDSVLGRW